MAPGTSPVETPAAMEAAQAYTRPYWAMLIVTGQLAAALTGDTADTSASTVATCARWEVIGPWAVATSLTLTARTFPYMLTRWATSQATGYLMAAPPHPPMGVI